MVHRISDDPAARRCIFEWPGLARSRIRTGLIVPPGGWPLRPRALIITGAAQHNLPAIYLRHFVTAGVKLSDFRTGTLARTRRPSSTTLSYPRRSARIA